MTSAKYYNFSSVNTILLIFSKTAICLPAGTRKKSTGSARLYTFRYQLYHSFCVVDKFTILSICSTVHNLTTVKLKALLPQDSEELCVYSCAPLTDLYNTVHHPSNLHSRPQVQMLLTDAITNA